MKFNDLVGASAASTSLDTAVQALINTQRASAGKLTSPETTRGMLSLESIDNVAGQRLASAAVGLKAALESLATTDTALAQGSMRAGIAAGLIAGDVKAYANHTFPSANADGSSVVGASGVDRMRPALEAYDERDNQHVTAYSVAYNYQAARQDELGELFFPTVVVTPDQVGYSLVIDLVEVQNDFKRNISGALENTGRRNIIQGLRDSAVLSNEQTRIYPVARTENAANLLANNLLVHKDVTVLGETFKTAPLLVGKKFSLLGLSQTDASLASGLQGPTDQIDTAVNLQNVYISVTDNASTPVTEYFSFPVERTPGATFNYNPQGNYRSMVLNYSTKSLMVNKNTKTATGSNPTTFPSVISGDWKVNLSVDINGQVNLDTSETSLNVGELTVVSVEGPDGTIYAPTAAAVTAVVALFSKAKVVAYDLLAYRSNMNRRQRGQLLNLNRFSQTFSVPLLSPITIPRPQGAGDGSDTSDLGALIAATRIRTSNAAVKELLAADATLAAWVDGREQIGNVPEIFSVSRFLVQPYYKRVPFDAAAATNSIRSQDRAKDIQAALMAVIRDQVYLANKDSGYKAAADSLNGGSSDHPLVLVGTDQVLSRYLWIEGEMRDLGIDFKMEVATSQNKDMAGKIFVSFGQKDSGKGAANPLHFGNMAWRPELTLVLPLSRDGQFSKELTVQPAFRHVTNLPILIRIDVTNLSDTAVKATVQLTNEV